MLWYASGSPFYFSTTAMKRLFNGWRKIAIDGGRSPITDGVKARVVVEVGTHSAWVQEVISGCGHEVLMANPRLIDGSKRRSLHFGRSHHS
jgi:hypothetical protein